MSFYSLRLVFVCAYWLTSFLIIWHDSLLFLVYAQIRDVKFKSKVGRIFFNEKSCNMKQIIILSFKAFKFKATNYRSPSLSLWMRLWNVHDNELNIICDDHWATIEINKRLQFCLLRYGLTQLSSSFLFCFFNVIIDVEERTLCVKGCALVKFFKCVPVVFFTSAFVLHFVHASSSPCELPGWELLPRIQWWLHSFAVLGKFIQ